VAWFEPESIDDDGYEFMKICPGGECEVFAHEDDEFIFPYLDVALPPGTFLDLGSKKEKVEGCNRVVFRFSILAPDEGGSQGRDLSVVIRGTGATGLVPDVLILNLHENERDIFEQYLENTYFYVVDTSIFEWPVSLRLVPVVSTANTFFGIRDFEMSCCN
jgi:hypothetical protein